MTAPPLSEMSEAPILGDVGEVGCQSLKKRPLNVVRRSKQPGNASWSRRIATRID